MVAVVVDDHDESIQARSPPLSIAVVSGAAVMVRLDSPVVGSVWDETEQTHVVISGSVDVLSPSRLFSCRILLNRMFWASCDGSKHAFDTSHAFDERVDLYEMQDGRHVVEVVVTDAQNQRGSALHLR